MRQAINSVAVFFLLVSGCTKFEEAEMTARNTFVHFYSSGTDYAGIVAELDTDGGYILSGEIKNDSGTPDALIVKTDSRGHKVWEKIIPSCLINSIKPGQNGYVLAGDSIKLNPGSGEVNELVNSYAMLLLMDSQGNISGERIISGSVRRSVNNQPVDLNIDYHADAFTIDATGNIILLGSYQVPGENRSTYVSAFNPANMQDSLWHRSYSSLDNDYINCKSLHLNNSSNLVWASNTHTQKENVTREYLSVAHVVPNSTFKGHSLFGESDVRNHAVADIQKSAVGFGVIGTYSETNGLNANMFFLRTQSDGTIVPESVRYVDGEDLVMNNAILNAESKNTSGSFDEGTAITSTSDGFILAGTMTSTPSTGNGGKDILLIKVDGFGNLIWKKLIGGSGDETVSSIRETPDHGLLICGTNTINGLSTMMLMKTDSDGNLDN